MTSCTGSEHPAAVPRQRAYPRIELYPSSYSPHDFENHTILVNDSAQIAATGHWLNITYPAYGLTVNCTMTPVNSSSAQSVLDNRTERMALNSGGAQSQLLTLKSTSGATATILVTESTAGLTPIQFIATDSISFVFSGAVTAQYSDSLRPAVNAVKADLLHLLQHLCEDSKPKCNVGGRI